MSFDAVSAVLLIPLLAAALLAVLPAYRLSARLNMLATLATFLTALSLFFGRPPAGPYLHVDDLNNVFIVLTTFVGFTTSVFSASYIGPRARDRPADADVPALLSRHVPAADVRHEPRAGRQQYRPDVGGDRTGDADHGAMVGIYRTHEALEAAWKYFILGSVGIALALFGTSWSIWRRLPVVGEGP
jgi:hydrogenase-4 component F